MFITFQPPKLLLLITVGIFSVLVPLAQSAELEEQTFEERMARTMKMIGEAWQNASDEHYPVVSTCHGDCYRSWFLDRASVEFDVKRTNNLLNPYEGFVRIRTFTRISSCFRAPDVALGSSFKDSGLWWGTDGKKVELLAIYKITRSSITLDKSNPDFDKMFCGIAKGINSALWSPMVSQAIK
jgi:hypothetical protein